MKLIDLFEMAAPTLSQLSKTYYHGTSKQAAGESILRNGIEPGDIAWVRKDIKGPSLLPVKGKVYITPDLSYAQMYTIGGDMAGTGWKPKTEQYGYMFQIDGADLSDIDPDEDSVGEMIWNQLCSPKNIKILQTLVRKAETLLTVKQFAKLKDGEYVMFAHAGKKIIPTMTDAEKLEIIDLGAHVAHTGKLFPSAAWKINLNRISELKRDASTFFEIAEKVL